MWGGDQSAFVAFVEHPAPLRSACFLEGLLGSVFTGLEPLQPLDILREVADPQPTTDVGEGQTQVRLRAGEGDTLIMFIANGWDPVAAWVCCPQRKCLLLQ